uniref:Putative ABC transporter n=1 Tax=Trypanosoma vivax (strain Y486) TaxID=1055687 RepID=G0U0H4_TRYVY|nr:putative ABC transporter, fragment [Trypanosoma vivax Y486]
MGRVIRLGVVALCCVVGTVAHTLEAHSKLPVASSLPSDSKNSTVSQRKYTEDYEQDKIFVPDNLARVFVSDNEECLHGGKKKDGDCICPAPGNFSGIRCEQCQSSSPCIGISGQPSTCDKKFTIRGNSKQFECALDSPAFLKLMGNGRDIEALVTFNCSTTDGRAFFYGKNGVCNVSVYRIEPKREYVDPFFRCNTSKCSTHLATVTDDQGGKSAGDRSHILKVGETIGQIVIITFCLSIVMIRCALPKLGAKWVSKIALALGGALMLSTVLFVTAMLVAMRPTNTSVEVVYDCNATECACAEDPPPKYQPICSKSLLNTSILPRVRNSIRYACNMKTGRCKLSLTDIALAGLLAAHVKWVFSKTRKAGRQFVEAFCPRHSRTASGSPDLQTIIEDRLKPNRPLSGMNDDEDAKATLGAPLRASSRPAPLIFESQERGVDSLCIPLQHDGENGEFVYETVRSSFELKVTDLEYTLGDSQQVGEAKRHPILRQMNFSVHSGEVLAIMGPSGAGKTTLLDLMSARAKQGKIAGEITFNSTPILRASSRVLMRYRNIVGYVSQEDTLIPNLTVRQTIEYAARLKLPQAFSNETINSIVQHVIKILRLERCENTVIGDGNNVRGVSGGEKRRVSIAVELLANPRILILDEPTSGLDAVSAKHVVEAIVSLAKEPPMQIYAPYYFAFRPIVIFSIHQPSQEIFRLFDKTLLLSRGMSVYCGPAHSAAESLEQRVLNAVGVATCIPRLAEHPNHAEYLMKLEELLDDGLRMELQAEDIANATVSSGRLCADGRSPPLEMLKDTAAKVGEGVVDGETILRTTESFRVYYANVYQQFALLSSRGACCLFSTLNLLMSHAAVTASVSILIIFLYNAQPLDLPGALNRAGAVTFLLLVVSFVSLSALEQLIAERKLLVVERENGYYSTLPYFLSKFVVDIIPLRVLPAMVFASLIYFPIGLRTDDGVHFFWFVFVVVLFSVCMTLIVLCVGVITGSSGTAALVSNIVILWNFVFGGLLVQSATVPAPLRPFQLISPFFLAFESLMVNELDGQSCTFSPTDETGKPSPTPIPIMCAQYLSNMGLQPARFMVDVGQLAAMTFMLAGATWILLIHFTTVAR